MDPYVFEKRNNYGKTILPKAVAWVNDTVFVRMGEDADWVSQKSTIISSNYNEQKGFAK
jgi:hypothetical protein